MFELDINKIKEQSMQFVDTAYKAAMDIADKGKNQLDLASQQNRLAKAQRQLGALVYSLHKADEENQPLVDKYIEYIAEIEKAIEEIKARMTPDEAAAAEAADSSRRSSMPDSVAAVRLTRLLSTLAVRRASLASTCKIINCKGVSPPKRPRRLACTSPACCKRRSA